MNVPVLWANLHRNEQRSFLCFSHQISHMRREQFHLSFLMVCSLLLCLPSPFIPVSLPSQKSVYLCANEPHGWEFYQNHICLLTGEYQQWREFLPGILRSCFTLEGEYGLPRLEHSDNRRYILGVWSKLRTGLHVRNHEAALSGFPQSQSMWQKGRGDSER